MDFGILFKRAGKVAAENSPAILTAIGVTGTLATAYLAAKGAFKASDTIREAQEVINQEEISHPLSTREQFDLTWKLYVPAAASAAMTVAAIICSARISDRRTAAMASAYSVVEKSYAEYRAKNLEKVGKTKEQAVRADIAQDKIDQNPVSKTTLVVTGNGETLCFDEWTGRYFTSDMETMRRAVNDFNARIINETYASLSEFYDLLGLTATTESDFVGWSTDKLLDIDIHGAIDKTGNPCLALEFVSKPMARFDSSF